MQVAYRPGMAYRVPLVQFVFGLLLHLLIIAVLPAQLQDVAKSMRPAPHALVLSLAGATPLAKVRQLFDSPHAVASSADATLPPAARSAARGRWR